MTHLTGTDRAEYVQEMFARIAWRYDVMNRLMTFGMDRRWRSIVLQMAELPPVGGFLLDLGAGTGDLGLESLRWNPRTKPVEIDFTLEMMRVGQKRPGTEALSWAGADAQQLPFEDGTFDAIVSGFLLRNVVDLPGCLREQYRVLKAGGRIVALDTTRPSKNLVTPFVRFYMHTLIPLLGRWISGEADAYIYLPVSSEGFLSAEALVSHLSKVGFGSIGFRRLNFGTIAIHWGVK
jgi:demethylmenaquinone methyltransferase/2-methoxy-6-polyprenyl-1,4-benzoquinol methylase